MSDAMIPFPDKGIPCLRCSTVFRGGRVDLRPAGDPGVASDLRYDVILTCASCFLVMRLSVGSVGDGGVAPWMVTEEPVA